MSHRSSQPLPGKLGTGRIALVALNVLMVFGGLFFTFSLAQVQALCMMTLPFLGIYGLMALRPAFLALYVAALLYLLPVLWSAAVGIPGKCADFFGDEDYCKEGWVTYLIFCMQLYQMSIAIQVFGCFFVFDFIYHDSGNHAPESSKASAPLLGSS